MSDPSTPPGTVRKGIRLTMAGLAGFLLWFFFRSPAGPPAPVVAGPAWPPSAPVSVNAGSAGIPAVILPGDKTLLGYGDPTQLPERDLTLLHRCLDNFLLLAKGMKTQPLSANGEIAAALRGEGKVRLAFLPPGHPISIRMASSPTDGTHHSFFTPSHPGSPASAPPGRTKPCGLPTTCTVCPAAVSCAARP